MYPLHMAVALGQAITHRMTYFCSNIVAAWGAHVRWNTNLATKAPATQKPLLSPSWHSCSPTMRAHARACHTKTALRSLLDRKEPQDLFNITGSKKHTCLVYTDPFDRLAGSALRQPASKPHERAPH